VRGALWLLLLASGCASQTGLGRATTLAPGVFQLTPALEGTFVSAKNSESGHTTAPWLLLGLGYRHGVTEWLELGGRVWGFGLPNYFTTAGVALDAKVQLYRGSRWHIATAPSVKYHAIALGASPWNIGMIELPVLFGFNFAQHQLVLGVRVMDALLTGLGTNPVNTFWVGTHVGVSFRAGRVEVMPELGVLYSPIPLNGETADSRRLGSSILHLGLGISIESSRQ
jgi:hypothetical protein